MVTTEFVMLRLAIRTLSWMCRSLLQGTGLSVYTRSKILTIAASQERNPRKTNSTDKQKSAALYSDLRRNRNPFYTSVVIAESDALFIPFFLGWLFTILKCVIYWAYLASRLQKCLNNETVYTLLWIIEAGTGLILLELLFTVTVLFQSH